MFITTKTFFSKCVKRTKESKAREENNFIKVVFWKAQKSQTVKFLTLLSMTMAALVIGDAAHAFSTPAAGSFGYNIYDIAINKVAQGPIGFVGGGWLIATAATKMNEGWVRALPYAIGGSCLIKVDELTTSLGALIH